MRSTARLASLLRATDDNELLAALERRALPTAGIRDFFDLADALLGPDSLQQCLERLDRVNLAALVSLGEKRMPTTAIPAALGLQPDDVSLLRELVLLDENDEGVTVWPEVTAQLDRWPELGHPVARNNDQEPNPANVSETERHSADHLAAEHAFTAATATAELLFELDREPARLLARGALGNPEKKRLAEAVSIDVSSLDTLVAAAQLAGLIARVGNRLVVATDRAAWNNFSTAERWAILAETWATNLPAGIRTVLSERADSLWGPGIRDWLHWRYPGGRDWLTERAAQGLIEAERLGITAGDIVSTPGAALLGGDRDRAIALLTATLPAPVDRLYLQHDLTAVAPGPLEATIDARLRTMAVVDGRAIASRYLFTPASVGRAMVGGETAESILEFFGEVSLSGVPQPLEYLITETAARHGLLRVGPMPPGDPEALSYLRSDDSDLLGTVLVDRTLGVLGLRPTDSRNLVSRRDRSQVYWMLHDARYPVAAEDSHGTIVELSRPTVSTGSAPTPLVSTPNPHRSLLDKLRASDAGTGQDTGVAWLARELEGAIRSKLTVTVSVRMPNGQVVDYRLEPASVAGGRLRAKDPLSEIERTLPLSSIAAVVVD
jgi:XPB/Ssl2-like helicase family protein